MTVVTAYMQTQGTTSGAFFDKDSMETLFHGEGFLEATREREVNERDQLAEVRMLSRSRARDLGALRRARLQSVVRGHPDVRGDAQVHDERRRLAS